MKHQKRQGKRKTWDETRHERTIKGETTWDDEKGRDRMKENRTRWTQTIKKHSKRRWDKMRRGKTQRDYMRCHTMIRDLKNEMGWYHMWWEETSQDMESQGIKFWDRTEEDKEKQDETRHERTNRRRLRWDKMNQGVKRTRQHDMRKERLTEIRWCMIQDKDIRGHDRTKMTRW